MLNIEQSNLAVSHTRTQFGIADRIILLIDGSFGRTLEMIAIAITLQQDPETITIAHIIRLLTINLSLPTLLGFAANQTAYQPSDSSPRHTSKSSSSK